MKLIDRFISRELIVNVLFAIAVLKPCTRGWKYFPQASSLAGESRGADANPDHFHRYVMRSHSSLRFPGAC